MVRGEPREAELLPVDTHPTVFEPYFLANVKHAVGIDSNS
jgi:hypothetical protein